MNERCLKNFKCSPYFFFPVFWGWRRQSAGNRKCPVAAARNQPILLRDALSAGRLADEARAAAEALNSAGSGSGRWSGV